MQLNNQKGMGLIEVIAALGLATMVITSLVSLSIFTLRSSLKSKLFIEASKLANRELELVRAYRDKNSWTVFTTAMENCTSTSVPKEPTCYMDLNAVAVNSGIQPPIDTMAIDEVSRGFYVEEEEGTIKVTVVIQWKEGAAVKKTTLRTDLTNWQQK